MLKLQPKWAQNSFISCSLLNIVSGSVLCTVCTAQYNVYHAPTEEAALAWAHTAHCIARPKRAAARGWHPQTNTIITVTWDWERCSDGWWGCALENWGRGMETCWPPPAGSGRWSPLIRRREKVTSIVVHYSLIHIQCLLYISIFRYLQIL